MSDPIRVVITDDQALFRRGLRVLLDAQPDLTVVGEAADGREALDVVATTTPDVLLLDMRMDGMDGAETVRQLFDSRQKMMPPRVIVITTFELDPAAATALRYGASGFLLKGASPEFLFATIRNVHAGGSVIAPSHLAQLFTTTTRRVRPPQPPAFLQLTIRERAVFAWVARGLSNSEIARAEFVAESTVKTQLSSVLNKLGLRDRVQLVIFAQDHGLAGIDDESGPPSG